MEFVTSRVVLCIGGAVLLASVSGALSATYDHDVDIMDGELADRFAGMLDSFEASQMDILILEGPSLLPSECSVHVHDNIVELLRGDKVHTAETRYSGDFSLDHTETAEITRRTSPLSS